MEIGAFLYGDISLESALLSDKTRVVPRKSFAPAAMTPDCSRFFLMAIRSGMGFFSD